MAQWVIIFLQYLGEEGVVQGCFGRQMCLCQFGVGMLLLLFFWVKDIYVMGYILGIICGSVGISGIGGIGGIKECVIIQWGSVGRSAVVSINIWCCPFSSMRVGISIRDIGMLIGVIV